MKAILFGALLAVSLSASAITEEEANRACLAGMMGFLANYEAAREHADKATILAGVRGAKTPSEFKKIIVRFVEADFAGDNKAANKALNEAHRFCVEHTLNPLSEA